MVVLSYRDTQGKREIQTVTGGGRPFQRHLFRLSSHGPLSSSKPRLLSESLPVHVLRWRSALLHHMLSTHTSHHASMLSRMHRSLLLPPLTQTPHGTQPCTPNTTHPSLSFESRRQMLQRERSYIYYTNRIWFFIYRLHASCSAVCCCA